MYKLINGVYYDENPRINIHLNKIRFIYISNCSFGKNTLMFIYYSVFFGYKV